MQVFATSHYQRNYFQHQIDDAAGAIIDYISALSQSIPNQEREEESPEQSQGQEGISSEGEEMRVFTREELATYNGSNGRAAYVAVDGTVYDVSGIPRWAGGTHFGLFSGNDLSSEFMACHAGMREVINRLPIAGVLQQE